MECVKTSAKEFLKNSYPIELVWNAPYIVYTTTDATVRDTLQLMQEKNFNCFPVVSKKDPSQYVGIISSLDLLMHIVFGKAGNKLAETDQKLSKDEIEACMNTPIGDLMNLTDEEKDFWIFDSVESLEKIAEALSKGVHRVLIGEDVMGIPVSFRFLSQVDLIRHLALNADLISDFCAIPVANIMTKDVVAIQEDTEVIQAFQKMCILDVSSLPIVNKEGKLVSVLSASDVRGLTDLEQLHQNVLQYRIWRTKSRVTRPVFVHKDATIETTILKAAMAQVHRVWVVDDNHKPIGCVSLTDIIRAATKN